MSETLNDALVACVKACGRGPKDPGSKTVGPLLWPEMDPEAAQRKLLDCLNPERAAKLSPEQALLIIRLARQRGCHIGMEYLVGALGYTMPVPIEPEDERAKLQREFIEASKSMARIAARIEQLTGAA